MNSPFAGRSIEFFESETGGLSSRNLTVILSMSVASLVVLYMAVAETLTEGIFGCYLLAGGGIYGFGKWTDAGVKKKQIEASTEVANVVVNKPE